MLIKCFWIGNYYVYFIILVGKIILFFFLLIMDRFKIYLKEEGGKVFVEYNRLMMIFFILFYNVCW